jgi:hypothetical protein
MTKKQIIGFLHEYKCSYSGNTRTMYVKGITQSRLDSFGLATSIKLVAQ